MNAIQVLSDDIFNFCRLVTHLEMLNGDCRRCFGDGEKSLSEGQHSLRLEDDTCRAFRVPFRNRIPSCCFPT